MARFVGEGMDRLCHFTAIRARGDIENDIAVLLRVQCRKPGTLLDAACARGCILLSCSHSSKRTGRVLVGHNDPRPFLRGNFNRHRGHDSSADRKCSLRALGKRLGA
jgi:hypothetical protein